MKKSLIAAFVIFSLLIITLTPISSERGCPCAKKEKVEPMAYVGYKHCCCWDSTVYIASCASWRCVRYPGTGWKCDKYPYETYVLGYNRCWPYTCCCWWS